MDFKSQQPVSKLVSELSRSGQAQVTLAFVWAQFFDTDVPYKRNCVLYKDKPSVNSILELRKRCWLIKVV